MSLFVSIEKTKKIFKRWPLAKGVNVVIAKTLAKANIQVSKRLLDEESHYVNLDKKGYELTYKNNSLLIKHKSWTKAIEIRRFSSDYKVFRQIFI